MIYETYITHHCNQRMSQRGITKDLLEITLKYGFQSGDKIILNKKTIQEMLSKKRVKFDNFERKILLKVLDKGGIVLICENNSLITTYNVNSYKRGKK